MTTIFSNNLISGDNVELSYSYDSGYTLELVLLGISKTTVAFTEVTAGGYEAEFTAPEQGLYSYSLRATLAGKRTTVEAGKVVVDDDIGDGTAGDDQRSANKVTLDLIKSVLDGRVTDGLDAYTIAGRSVSKMPISELIQLRDYYTALVNRERGRGGITFRSILI